MSEVANRVLKNSGYLYFSMGLSMFVSLYSTNALLIMQKEKESSKNKKVFSLSV